MHTLTVCVQHRNQPQFIISGWFASSVRPCLPAFVRQILCMLQVDQPLPNIYRLQSVTRATAVNSYIPFSNEVIKRYFYPHLKNGLYIIIRLKVVASPTKTTLLSRNMLSKTVRINTTKMKLHKQFLLMELNFRFNFSFTSQSLASQCC